MKQTKPNKSEKICCEYIKDGECTLNERGKADCCPKNRLYTKSQVDEMINQANKLDKACKDEEFLAELAKKRGIFPSETSRILAKSQNSK